MITETKIVKLIEAHLAGSDIFLVDVLVKTGNKISVFIDGDHGVTIDSCRELNHFLNESLDRDTEDFDLTVSSAGADRPLKLPRQYQKNAGKALDVVTNTGEKFSGVVTAANETGIELEIPPLKKSKKEPEVKKIVSLKYGDIKSAKEVITFKQ
ncbi:MAG: ribosome assembly cofactor RimP [Bacteroidetes bacterium]|nr:ribosome assembly cofactor RimP [Bacteroidota bacterium]